MFSTLDVRRCAFCDGIYQPTYLVFKHGIPTQSKQLTPHRRFVQKFSCDNLFFCIYFFIIGLVGSIANGLTFLVTPLTALLLQRLSCRVVILAGMLLYCAGLFTTSFVTEFGYMYLTFGVLMGIGANFSIYSSNYLILVWFRNANHARAFAMAVTGSSCGTI